MAVPGTLQEKIVAVKDKYDLFGLTEQDVKVAEEGEEDALSWAVGEVVQELLEVVELREKVRDWMDVGCHEEWDTKNKEPMKDIHLERYMEVYSKISNETTLVECLVDEEKEWAERDTDEWCCEKCWKTETVIRKRNIYLFGSTAMADKGEGREDYLLHTYDPREKRALLTCNSCQTLIESEIEEPDTETEMCVECGICDLMSDDNGPLSGRFRMSGHHDLDEEGEVSFFYNGYHCPTCVRERTESYESMLWRSGRTVSDYFGSGWLLGRDEKEWKPMGPLYDDSDDDLELTSDEEDNEERRTYRGEYENAESEDEESSRSAIEIMGKVKDIGEILFDYQDKIKEGDYLRICNLLQGIVKDSNRL
jgi:hypothetical protein